MAEYVAYIDEAGDPGVSSIAKGGTPWFLLSCVLVRQVHVPTLANTHHNILLRFRNRQTDYLHFKNLIPAKKMIACEELSKTPCRAFVMVSNKQNIQGRWKVQIMENRDWLYWWMTRILMEKVTDFCWRHAAFRGEPNPSVRFHFSRRGGNSYEHLAQYLARLKAQSEAGALVVSHGDIKWDLVDLDKITAIDAKNSLGLQLSDVVAGAFFNSLESGISTFNADYAKTLLPIIPKCIEGRRIDYGLKTMPYIRQIHLDNSQKEIFKHYGYVGRWAPGS